MLAKTARGTRIDGAGVVVVADRRGRTNAADTNTQAAALHRSTGGQIGDRSGCASQTGYATVHSAGVVVVAGGKYSGAITTHTLIERGARVEVVAHGSKNGKRNAARTGFAIVFGTWVGVVADKFFPFTNSVVTCVTVGTEVAVVAVGAAFYDRRFTSSRYVAERFGANAWIGTNFGSSFTKPRCADIVFGTWIVVIADCVGFCRQVFTFAGL